jgi:hypothetical protein
MQWMVLEKRELIIIELMDWRQCFIVQSDIANVALMLVHSQVSGLKMLSIS